MLTAVVISAGIGAAHKEEDEKYQAVGIVKALRDGVDDRGTLAALHMRRDTQPNLWIASPDRVPFFGEAIPLAIGGDWPRIPVYVQSNPDRRWDDSQLSVPITRPTMQAPDAPASVEEFRRGYTDIEAIICAYPWPCEEALAVAWCESRFDPRAVGGYNYGLFQINAVHVGRVPALEELLDAATNVRVAYAIYIDNAGWAPWACKPY